MWHVFIELSHVCLPYHREGHFPTKHFPLIKSISSTFFETAKCSFPPTMPWRQSSIICCIKRIDCRHFALDFNAIERTSRAQLSDARTQVLFEPQFSHDCSRRIDCMFLLNLLFVGIGKDALVVIESMIGHVRKSFKTANHECFSMLDSRLY